MLQEIIVLTVAYIALIGLLQPKKKTVAPIADSTAPIDYFPEVKETTEPLAQPEPKAKSTLASLIKEEVAKPAVLAPTALCPVTIATAPAQPIQGFTPDLSKMGVRDLYRLASNAGIKGYKKLSKAQLVQALA